MSSISNISTSYVQQAFASVLQDSGLTASGASSGTTASTTSDTGQLSSFAQLVSSLEQLQQSNPAEYKQVTGEIATNLTTAAQTAKSQGNSGAANQLTVLAGDFSTASRSGQLPNFSDPAQTTGASGGHRHHHHGSAPSSGSSTNPAAIIGNTLSNAGVPVSSNSTS